MAVERPTTVIFDLGGVLIDWNPRYLYRRLFDGDEPAMERFLAEVCTPDWNLSLDAGRPLRRGGGRARRRATRRSASGSRPTMSAGSR